MSATAVKAEASLELQQLAELRRTFDRTFAAPPAARAETSERMIAIRVAGESFMLRGDHTTGLFKASRIVPLPSRIPELLGIAAVRGVLVPVFSLQALLNVPPHGGTAFWLALANREAPVALAFDELEGQVEVARACLYSEERAAPRQHIGGLVRVGSAVRPVIDVPTILQAIRNSAGLAGSVKE